MSFCALKFQPSGCCHCMLVTNMCLVQNLILSILEIFCCVGLDNISMIKLLTCGNSKIWLLNLSQSYKTLLARTQSDLLISMLQKLNLIHLTIQVIVVLLRLKLMGLSLRKNNAYFTLSSTYVMICSKYIVKLFHKENSPVSSRRFHCQT